MRFKIYQTADYITLKQYRELKLLNDIYVPFISDFPELNNQIYILDFDIDKTLKTISALSLNLKISPKTIEQTSGDLVECYLDEDEAKKFINNIKETRQYQEGDYIKLKEYHNLPFRVDKVFNRLLQVSHEANNLRLELQVKNDRSVPVEDEGLIFYQAEKIQTPINIIFIDCDLFGDISGLVRDIITIKTIYKNYKIYLINPLGVQGELGVALGLSYIQGNKFKITQSVLYKANDLVYTDDLNYLRFLDRILLRVKHLNIYLPEIISEDITNLEFKNKDNSIFLEGTRLRYKVLDIDYLDLDYQTIKDFIKRHQIDALVEDIPFYLKLIKR